jgi:hypothetical protein
MSAEIEELIAAQNASSCQEQKRRSERFEYPRQLYAQLLEIDFTPIGEPFLVKARNLSTGGISLIHSAPLDSGILLGIQLSRDDSQAIKIVMRVIRSMAIDGGYEVAGRFVTRL